MQCDYYQLVRIWRAACPSLAAPIRPNDDDMTSPATASNSIEKTRASCLINSLGSKGQESRHRQHTHAIIHHIYDGCVHVKTEQRVYNPCDRGDTQFLALSKLPRYPEQESSRHN